MSLAMAVRRCAYACGMYVDVVRFGDATRSLLIA